MTSDSRCPVCGTTDPTAANRCYRPDCSDGRGWVPTKDTPNARPAPEAGSVVERLEKLAAWADRSQHEKWCVRGDAPIHGYSGEGKLIREAADLLASLSAKVAEVERERDAYENSALIRKAALDQVQSVASELQREVERLKRERDRAEGYVIDQQTRRQAAEARAERMVRMRMTVAALECRGGSLPALDAARAALQREGKSDE